MAYCSWCNRKGVTSKIEIINVTSKGICFKCPKHGTCGHRRDSMTNKDETCFGNALNLIGFIKNEDREYKV